MREITDSHQQKDTRRDMICVMSDVLSVFSGFMVRDVTLGQLQV